MTLDSGSLIAPVNPDACWRSIGIWGDRTCEKLADHVHCRQCPSWSHAARQLLRTSAMETDSESYTTRVAAPVVKPETGTQSAIVFRLANDWYALPVERFREITGQRVIHSIPGRKAGVRGLVNIRGQLLICIRLETILELPETGASPKPNDHGGRPRFMVLTDPNGDVVVPVDDVQGMMDYSPEKLKLISETDRDTRGHLAGGLSINGRLIAFLRTDAVFDTINTRLA